jgi:glycosyltransferase involved in cell wall biosynthesis
LFDPDDGEALTAKVLALLDNRALRKRLGEQARKDLLASYTWEHHARKIVAIFEEILERRKAKGRS